MIRRRESSRQAGIHFEAGSSIDAILPSSTAMPIRRAVTVLAIDAELVRSPGWWPFQCRSRTRRPLWTTSRAAAFFDSASRAASANASGARPSATGSGTGCSTPGTASLGRYQATSRMLLAGWLRIREM